MSNKKVSKIKESNQIMTYIHIVTFIRKYTAGMPL